MFLGEGLVGKLSRQRCPGCGKLIGRHDANRYEEPRASIEVPRRRAGVWGCPPGGYSISLPKSLVPDLVKAAGEEEQ